MTGGLPYKGHPFHRRTRFAAMGLVHAWALEASFRTQVGAAIAAAMATAWLRPGWGWAALVAVSIVLVLMAELINTSLEAALDGLHPESAPFVARAKDCAAAAVLLASLNSVVVFACMVFAVMV